MAQEETAMPRCADCDCLLPCPNGCAHKEKDYVRASYDSASGVLTYNIGPDTRMQEIEKLVDAYGKAAARVGVGSGFIYDPMAGMDAQEAKQAKNLLLEAIRTALAAGIDP